MADMMSWSCMTPFYSEDVVYSRGDLDHKNEDGLTTLMYLQVCDQALLVGVLAGFKWLT